MAVRPRIWYTKSGAKRSSYFIKFDIAGITYHFRATNPLNKKQKARDKKEALKYEAEFRLRVIQGLPLFVEDEIHPQAITFRDFVTNTYLPWSKFNKRSYQSDSWRSQVLIAAFGDMPIDKITPFTIEKLKVEQREGITIRGTIRAPASVNRLLELLSRIFTLAIDNGILNDNPCRRVRKLRLDNWRYRFLDEEEEKILLENCVGRLKHYRALVILAINTGMRRGELLKLQAEEVDLTRALVRVRQTKTARDRAIPINEEARQVFEKLIKKTPRGRLFKMNDICKAWRRMCNAAGLEDLHFHDLRHTFATRLADAGADAFTIAALLGHTSIQMAMRYTHARDQRKREAVEALGNRRISVAKAQSS